jgi:hypothetical protein
LKTSAAIRQTSVRTIARIGNAVEAAAAAAAVEAVEAVEAVDRGRHSGQSIKVVV